MFYLTAMLDWAVDIVNGAGNTFLEELPPGLNIALDNTIYKQPDGSTFSALDRLNLVRHYVLLPWNFAPTLFEPTLESFAEKGTHERYLENLQRFIPDPRDPTSNNSGVSK